ncbi:MAG: response regulator [Planctomycetaceae bacterium]|nr:response regulator [Planctomycetaceae bacterium]
MVRILVVDDSTMDRRLAGGLLRRDPSWEVMFAEDGENALQQIELHLPDLVLTDMQMPGMDGLQLVQAVRESYPLIPVVLMTARGSEELAVQALQEGAASYVSKRQLSFDLVETVERVLNSADKRRNFSRLMTRLKSRELQFELENDLTLLPAAVQYMQDMCGEMRLIPEADRLRVSVALEEALVNAYYHGNLEVSSDLREQDHAAYYDLAKARSEQEPWSSRRIHLKVQLSSRECVFSIRDEGPGFDPSTLRDATAVENLDRPCGRGLLLMRTFMNSVEFGPSGNEVILKKEVKAQDPREDEDDECSRDVAETENDSAV